MLLFTFVNAVFGRLLTEKFGVPNIVGQAKKRYFPPAAKLVSESVLTIASCLLAIGLLFVPAVAFITVGVMNAFMAASADAMAAEFDPSGLRLRSGFEGDIDVRSIVP